MRRKKAKGADYRRSQRLRIWKKRQNEEYRMKERLRDRERKRKLRQNEDYLRMERARDAKRKRVLRLSEKFRQEERAKDVIRKRELRKNENYRNKERRRNTEWKRKSRENGFDQMVWDEEEKLDLEESQFFNITEEQEEEYLQGVLKGEIMNSEQIEKRCENLVAATMQSSDIKLSESLFIPEVIIQEL